MSEPKQADQAKAAAIEPYKPGPGEYSAERIRDIYAKGGSMIFNGRQCPTINHLPANVRAAILTPQTEDPELIKAQIEALQAKLKPAEETKAPAPGQGKKQQ